MPSLGPFATVGDDVPVGTLIVVVGLCLAIGLVLVPWALSVRRADDAETAAAKAGLAFSASDPFSCTRVAFQLFRKGDDASVAEAERLHAGVLPLLTYVMASPEHMLCYGKRLYARRIGLAQVHPRHPCILPHEFGTAVAERYGAGLPALAN